MAHLSLVANQGSTIGHLVLNSNLLSRIEARRNELLGSSEARRELIEQRLSRPSTNPSDAIVCDILSKNELGEICQDIVAAANSLPRREIPESRSETIAKINEISVAAIARRAARSALEMYGNYCADPLVSVSTEFVRSPAKVGVIIVPKNIPFNIAAAVSYSYDIQVSLALEVVIALAIVLVFTVAGEEGEPAKQNGRFISPNDFMGIARAIEANSMRARVAA